MALTALMHLQAIRRQAACVWVCAGGWVGGSVCVYASLNAILCLKIFVLKYTDFLSMSIEYKTKRLAVIVCEEIKRPATDSLQEESLRRIPAVFAIVILMLPTRKV